jgi:hypothetical protein
VNFFDPKGTNRYEPDQYCYFDEDRSNTPCFDAPGGGSTFSADPAVGEFDSPANPEPDRLDKSKLLSGANKLLSKVKCADFVLGAIQAGFLDENGAKSADELNTPTREIYNGFSADSVSRALAEAHFNDAGASPAQSENGQSYTIIAHANFKYDGTSNIEFYDPFFSQGTTAQYQTAIHEAMHLIWNISDTNFAKAVGAYTEGMGGLAASQAWNSKLKENCK